MTFLEAAIEILRTADEPLTFAEVAKRAVDSNLLSHVGRDPEAAMRSCLNSASRIGRDGAEPLIIRDKPGCYALRPGAELPPSPPRDPAPSVAPPVAPQNSQDSDDMDGRAKVRSRRRGGGGDDARAPAAEAPVVVAPPVRDPGRAPRPDRTSRPVEFVAPEGSGLDGVTDVALVMANAMSRLVEERPELRQELDAMQQQNQAEPARPEPRERESRDRERERDRDRARDAADERGGRRRRRRRRRGRRVEWTGAGEAKPLAGADRMLDEIASVLEAAGARSLHVRQVAEQLASRGTFGAEVSEIERAATAALLLDIRQHGRASRFAARGDARYQLQGTRVPERAARAEAALREAVREVEQETTGQFIQWLQSLGTRSLESLVRIWLRREGYGVQATLPPARGVGRLVVEDPESEEDDGRLLVVIVPRRTALDAKAWEGDPERNGCAGVLAFSMADGAEDLLPDARVVGVAELASWLRENGIGVQRLTLEVTVLDPTVIESVAGLDS